MCIIFSVVRDMPYPFALLFVNFESLHQRRINQGKQSSVQYVNPTVALITSYRLNATLKLFPAFGNFVPTQLHKHVLDSTVLSLIMHY